MTAPFLNPGFRATDSDDNPLAGGTIRFYAAGTTAPKAVFADVDMETSLGTVVNLNSSGTPVSGSNAPVLIFPGIGDYKMRYYTSADVMLFEFDNIPGAVEEEEEETTATPVIPVISKTTTYTVTAEDRGKLINANATGGSFAIHLPSAVTMGDGFIVGVRNNGTSGRVSVVATGGQTIRGYRNITSFPLPSQGETAWFASDGSDWVAYNISAGARRVSNRSFLIVDRLTSAPANPAAGAYYLINGTPTGVWSTLGFVDKSIAEADGNGGWIQHAPIAGWLAFDNDDQEMLVYRNSAWEPFKVDPGQSTLKSFIVQDQKSSGTHGGTATATTWTTAVLNTSVVNTIDDSSLAANTITLPAGRYRIHASKVFVQTGASRIRFKTATGTDVLIYGTVVQAGFLNSTVSNNAASGANSVLYGEFEISESTDFIIQYYVEMTQGTGDLGEPASASGVVEVYASVMIEDLAAQQGPQGDDGGDGEPGLDGGYPYQFNTATSGDPGSGKIRLNHATPSSATEIAVHETNSAGAAIGALIAAWDDSTSADKAVIRLQKAHAAENILEYRITGTGTDEGAYWTFPVEYVGGAGTIANGNDMAVMVDRVGDIGDPGTTVPDIAGLTELAIADLDRATDFLAVVDTSAAGATKKIKPNFFALSVDDSDDITEGSTKLLMTLAERAKLTGFDVVVPAAARDGVTDDTAAINTALSGGNKLVYLSAGTYYVTGILRLYANTHLWMHPDCTILSDNVAGGLVFLNGEYGNNSYATVYGGEGNIHVRGGHIDFTARDPADEQCVGFAFAHAFDISVEGVRFTNLWRGHAIELNSVRKGRVRNCSFEDFTWDTGDSNREAINIDHARSASFPHFGGWDDTPCDDIIVDGNYFDTVQEAVGNHSSDAAVHTNIRIINNTIKNVTENAIHPRWFFGGVVSGNRVHDAGLRGIYAQQSDDLVITENHLTKTAQSTSSSALFINGGHRNIVRNNIISNAGEATNYTYAFDIQSGSNDNIVETAGAVAGSSGLIENDGTRSIINGAVFFSLADDTAASWLIPAQYQQGLLWINSHSNSNPSPRGLLWIRTAGGAVCTIISFVNTTNITATTGTLAGTTGSDGNFTISTHTDGMVYIENRSGSTRRIDMRFMGS